MRALLASAFLALAGCGGGDESGVTVFAASSLAEVAPAVDPAATVILGGSSDLAAQIRDGARADVLLTASAAAMEQLREGGLVEEPVVFASNRLVLVVARSVPAGRIESLEDLARADAKLVLGGEGVPVGDYAREALATAGLEGRLNVVSLEQDVKGVLGKVALGEADAGIVYATDARAAGGDVRPVAIPNALQPDVRYYAAAVSPASSEALVWLERLAGAPGAEALRAAGFEPR